MKITDNVELIDQTMANVYVLHISDKIVQIDTGMKNNAKRIINFYTNHGEKPDIVLITHYHIDHVGALKSIYDKYHPEIFAHGREIPVLQGLARYAKPKAMSAKILFALIKPAPVENIKSFEHLTLPGLTVIETPGHTPGSSSFYLAREKLIFIGDAATTVNGTLTLITKYTADITTAKKSLEKIRAMSPITVLPGHGAPLRV